MIYSLSNREAKLLRERHEIEIDIYTLKDLSTKYGNLSLSEVMSKLELQVAKINQELNKEE